MTLGSVHMAAVAAIGLIACGSGSDRADERASRLVHAPHTAPEPVRVDDAARDPGVLARALAARHSDFAASLGAHRFRGTSRLRVTLAGDEVEAIDDETRIDFAANGDFHATLENSREYGRDVYFVGGALYLRPRYGNYHRRAPADKLEPAGILNDIYATLGDYFELVAHAARPKDLGATTHAGRPARRVGLELAGKPRKRAETAAHKLWRNDAAVRTVSGEVVLDDATGAVLQGSFTGEVGFVREGKSYVMRLEVTHELSELGQDPGIAAPPEEQTVATRPRSHEADDRDTLLEGIAPPPRKITPK